MKINKYILGLAVAVLGGFSSCNTDVESTIYKSQFEHVSFDGTSASVALSVDETSTTIPVTITRGKVTSASTVTFTAEASENGIFSNDANGTVNFEAGKNSVTFNVSANNLQKDQSYTYTLKLSEAAVLTADTITKVAQNTTYTIKVSRAGDWSDWEPWNSEGTAVYYYAGITFTGSQEGLPFYYRYSLNDKTKYQFKLEEWCEGVDFILDYDTNTGQVVAQDTYTGYTHSTYGPISIVDYTLINPETTAKGSFDEEQGIIAFPAYYYDPTGPWGADYEYIYIDGYVRADYTTTVAYFGRLTDASDNDFLLADITFGKDVEYVRYALVTESEVDATVEALAAGGGEKLTESGRVSIPVAESGTYYLVVVAFAGDKAVNADATKMKFTSSKETAETWKPIYVGNYTYTVADYTETQIGGIYEGTIEAVLYQSEKDANRYKIAPWADLTGEEGLVFTMSEEGVLTVDQVYTGYTDDEYGDVFATDFVTADVADMPSTYADGVFTFNLMYHDAEGAWTYVADSFTITGEIDGASAAKRAQKANRSQTAKHVKNNVKLAKKFFSPVKKSFKLFK